MTNNTHNPTIGRTIPVRYTSNPDRLFYGFDEFGECVAILAHSFEDAWEGLADFAFDRDGECDHGNDPAIKSDEDAWELCDCEASSNGPVWTVYYSLRETNVSLDQFEQAFGEDAERIPTL